MPKRKMQYLTESCYCDGCDTLIWKHNAYKLDSKIDDGPYCKKCYRQLQPNMIIATTNIRGEHHDHA